jgi:hypothetical protein
MAITITAEPKDHFVIGGKRALFHQPGSRVFSSRGLIITHLSRLRRSAAHSISFSFADQKRSATRAVLLPRHLGVSAGRSSTKNPARQSHVT